MEATNPSFARTMKSGQAVRIARMHKATIHQALKDVGIRCARAKRGLPNPELESFVFLSDACGSAANALSAAIDVATIRPEKDGCLQDGTIERMQEVAYLQGACAYEALRVADLVLSAMALFSENQPATKKQFDYLQAVAASCAPAFGEPLRLRALQQALVSTQVWLRDWVVRV